MPIELWEIKIYSNEIVLFDKIITPEKSESIKTISKKSEVIRKVNKEIKVYTEESHLQNKPELILRLYNVLKENILAIDHDINFKPTKIYITFAKETKFVDIVPRKSDILIFLNLKKGMLSDPRKKTRDISKLGHWRSGDYEIKLSNTKDIDYIMSLIKQSYDKNEENFKKDRNKIV